MKGFNGPFKPFIPKALAEKFELLHQFELFPREGLVDPSFSQIDLNGKTIVQYHLQNWPDHGTVSPRTLAELAKLVINEDGKVLAHCSAGIGRTMKRIDKKQVLFSISQLICAILRKGGWE